MRKIIILFLLITGCWSSCNRQTVPKTQYCDIESENELFNEDLERVIMEYAISQQYSNNSARLFRLEKRNNGKETVFHITAGGCLGMLIDPNIHCFMRIENFWIGYRDLTVKNKRMKLSEIATALKDDFPDLYEDYLIYREMKKRFDPSAKGILQCLSDYDVWEAVFKGDTLFSKRMIYP